MTISIKNKTYKSIIINTEQFNDVTAALAEDAQFELGYINIKEALTTLKGMNATGAVLRGDESSAELYLFDDESWIEINDFLKTQHSINSQTHIDEYWFCPDGGLITVESTSEEDAEIELNKVMTEIAPVLKENGINYESYGYSFIKCIKSSDNTKNNLPS